MGEIKKRSEIEEKYKWDLTKIYKSEKEFISDVEETEKQIKAFSKYKDVMLKSAKDLYETVNAMFSLSRKVHKIYTYASLKHHEDLSNSKSIELLDKANNLEIKFSQGTSFHDPLLLSLDYKDIEKMYKEYDKLKEYEIYFKRAFRFKKYMLSEQEEKLIDDLSKAYSDNEKIFDTLTDSDLDYGIIKDANNKEVALNTTNYTIYIKSKDRKVRESTFKQFYGTFKRYKTTFANLLEGKAKNTSTFNKIRGYKSSLYSAMYNDELDEKVYNALIDSVSNGLEPLFKYYKLKKDILKLNDIHIYDTYVDVIEKYNRKYTYEDAKKIIIETLSIFGEEYVKNIKKAFDEHWIDVMPNIGKTSGAFSGGSYDTYPYILTNFQGEYNDITTLIHELGHSMHSYYSRTNNPYEYSGYSIVVAEVASTVNELLLAKHVIETTDNIEEKLYILDRLMGLFKATIYRQTMYEEFEKFIYDNVENEVTLTSDLLCDKFYELNKKYYGEDVVVDDEIRYEWARMPHLYYDFYMYKYATGLSAACQIVNQILEGKENAKENYIKFLKSGSTLPPNEELKINGVDLTNKNVCDNAIKMFSEIVDEFEKTYKEYKKSSGDLNG